MLLVVEVEAGGLHQREAVEHHQVEGAGEEEVEVGLQLLEEGVVEEGEEELHKERPEMKFPPLQS